ncbi:hypothetical protein Tco_1249319, partial [Tanacetum coccineum]
MHNKTHPYVGYMTDGGAGGGGGGPSCGGATPLYEDDAPWPIVFVPWN